MNNNLNTRSKAFHFSLIIFLSLIMTLVLCGEGNSKESKKVINLKLAHFWPSTHFIEKELVQGWAKAIQDATNGEIIITSYPSETLLKSTETYGGVVKGIADIGMSAYAWNRGRFPVMETFMTPGIVFNNSRSAGMAAYEGIKQLNPKEIQDTKQLMTWGAGPGHLLMKTAIRNKADLKGVEIGVTGGQRGEAIKLLGATPVVMSMPESYDAQSKGVIKGTLSTLSVMKGFRLGEVTNYVTLTPFIYNQLFYMVMNKEKWDSLSPNLQDAITKVTDKFYKEKVIGLLDIDNEKALKFYQEKRKVEVISLSESETKDWIETIKPVLGGQISILNKQGLPGEQIAKIVRELSEKYNKIYK